jgi:muramoyltetrapeptide carboxypeptidase
LEEEEIRGIFCLRGGYGSMRILPFLEPEFLQQHPKVFVGFSDLTALLLHLLLQGRMVTFHGPTLAHEDLARGPESLTARALKRVLLQGKPPEPLRGEILREGVAEGPLIGGCLSLLSALTGTPYAPRFSGCIGFFEDTGEPPYRIDRMLLQLRLSGALEGIRGVVLGPFQGEIPPSSLRKTVLDALAPLEVPILLGVPSGHGEINFTLPLGIPVRLDARQGILTFLEAGVSGGHPEGTVGVKVRSTKGLESGNMD